MYAGIFVLGHASLGLKNIGETDIKISFVFGGTLCVDVQKLKETTGYKHLGSGSISKKN